MNHTLLTSIMIGSAVASAYANEPTGRPNIVLIMCDDMGFSDLGCYGSEIKTPNIDRLAHHGVRFSRFTNTGRSCPSRAALMTGRYQHEVGMGWMTAVDEHRPGYRGQISKEYPTIAEVMKTGGYSTYMSGKWHLTLDGSYGKPNGSMPTQRRFDRYYGCLSGGGSYYRPKPLYNDMTPIPAESLPDDYYYTTAITDSAAMFIDRHDTRKPMFMYVAYYAPHLPLHAPEERIALCRRYYSEGYDTLRQKRFEKQKQIGLFPYDTELPVYDYEFGGERPAWNDLTEKQKQQWVNDMATYAAMIEIMDDGVGKIIDALRNKGMLDNTVFFFLSDNGSTSETGLIKQLMADLSNTPYRSYKQWCLNGGIFSPMIAAFGDPDKNLDGQQGKWSAQRAHITDIMPTCMELAGINYPEQSDYSVLPGLSLANAIADVDAETPRTMYYEHQTSCAIIDGDLKLVRYDEASPWLLFDLSTDPFEQNDLQNKYPSKAEYLEQKWNKWAKSHKVLPLFNLPWGERIKYYTDKNPDQSGTSNE